MERVYFSTVETKYFQDVAAILRTTFSHGFDRRYLDTLYVFLSGCFNIRGFASFCQECLGIDYGISYNNALRIQNYLQRQSFPDTITQETISFVQSSLYEHGYEAMMEENFDEEDWDEFQGFLDVVSSRTHQSA
jgi:hypothetical protein